MVNRLDIDFLRSNIDFTNVNPCISQQKIKEFCEKAIQHKVKTVYVPPIFTKFACNLVNKHKMDVGTTAGFPHGNIPVELKKAGITFAAEQGATWVDVVINISLVKSHLWSEVEKEVKELVNESKNKEIGIKLIIETPYLTDEEIIKVVKIADSCKVDYIKTATGIGTKVTSEHIKLIKPLLKNSKLKAAGGISTLKEAINFFNSGADIVGSSKGFEILEEILKSKGA